MLLVIVQELERLIDRKTKDAWITLCFTIILHTTSAIVDSIRRGSGTVVVHVGSQQHAGAPAKQGQADKAPHPARGGDDGVADVGQ